MFSGKAPGGPRQRGMSAQATDAHSGTPQGPPAHWQWVPRSGSIGLEVFRTEVAEHALDAEEERAAPLEGLHRVVVVPTLQSGAVDGQVESGCRRGAEDGGQGARGRAAIGHTWGVRRRRRISFRAPRLHGGEVEVVEHVVLDQLVSPTPLGVDDVSYAALDERSGLLIRQGEDLGHELAP